MPDHIHQKIVFNDTIWKPFFFVDLYRFGKEQAEKAPTVYYIGGAGDSKRFEDRVNTEPAVLFNEFSKALDNSGERDVTLIVSPAPLTTPEQRENRLDDFLSFFFSALIPKTLGTLPRRIAFVGSAYGSFFATYLALKLEQCSALSIISGMGMIEALEKSGGKVRNNLSIACYSNLDDEIRSWTDEFVQSLKMQGREIEVFRKPGERRFDDYRNNGSVMDAFKFVLKNL